MSLRINRRARRLLFLATVSAVSYLLLWCIVIPLDSPIRLAVNFNVARLRIALQPDRDAYLARAARYPLNVTGDVGYLVKTGYGTRDRVPQQLGAFAQSGGLLGEEGKDFVVVGDWTTVNTTDAARVGVPVYDAIRHVLDHKLGAAYESSPRVVKYRQLQEAIAQGNDVVALDIGRRFGWELDALKFMLGMDLLYQKMPNKKWYIILDDDTYLVRPSLELVLSHLNPDEPLYIGNAVGDFRARFAHGGSAVVISGAAMRKLFVYPKVVQAAYRESLSETWGDRLVAMTLQKIGVYLDEHYNHHFNGEHPLQTRISADRFCSPIVSFHNLRQQGDMAMIGEALASRETPLHWGSVLEVFGGHSLQDMAQQRVQRNKDHIGPADVSTRRLTGFRSAETCRAFCEDEKRRCLAWTFKGEDNTCLVSPWMAVGKPVAGGGGSSGVSWPQVEALLRLCPIKT